MQRSHSCLTLTLAFLLAASAGASRIHRGPTSPKQRSSKSGKHSKHAKATAAAAKPRAMDDERATQIQTALVKAGYLNEVSGHWDSASQAAMQKMQSDNGWQTKMIPDSRALIKLGLGPSAGLAPGQVQPDVEHPTTSTVGY